MTGQSDRGFGFGTLDRLHQPGEFAAVMGSRKRILVGGFELRYRERPSGEVAMTATRARLGLIVPKRLARQAVLRNLLKRIARESFRSASRGLPPMDFVLRLAKPALGAGGQSDRAQRRAWRKTIDELLAGVPR